MKFFLYEGHIMKNAPSSGLRLAFLAAPIFASLHAQPAHAGAYTQPEGHGQVIVSGTITDSSRYFDAKGNIVRGPAYTKAEFPVLVEYGLKNWLTVIVTPTPLHTHYEYAGTSDSYGGLEYVEAGARVRLYSSPNSVFSVQATTRQPVPRDKAAPAQVGYTDVQNDVRLLYGHSFTMAGMPSFVDFQAAYRLRNGAPPDEWHFDATLGFRPRPDVMLLAQSFNVVSNGAGYGPFPETKYSKVQLSAVFELSKQWAVQIGGITSIAGENQIVEPGVVAGVWYRF